MYADLAVSARLATIEQYQHATSLIIESTGQWMSLYARTGRAMLGSSGEATPLPNLLLEHLHLAGSAGKDLIRLLNTQIDTSNRLIRVSLEKARGATPPEAEIAIDNTEFAVAKGVELANEVGQASLKMIDEIESKVKSKRPRRSGRKAN